MHEEENRKDVAELWASGATRREIAEKYDVTPDTVSVWVNRDDVAALVDRLVRERTNRVLRRVDSRIEGILSHVEKLSLDELLKVRKEFVPDRRDINVNVSKEGALEELWERVADDPVAAAAILGLDADDAPAGE